LNRFRHFTDVLKWQGMPARSSIERALPIAERDTMATKKSAEPSPESVARANRQRLAVEEGARAMVDIEQQAIAVRKNMERLRALREAREVEGVTSGDVLPTATKKKRK
jgi:hypothetical protein